MPATSPPVTTAAARYLATIGATLRSRRRQLRISSTTMAEAAGMSRVTLQRIERGEPSVTMGAYLNALTALGMGFELGAEEAGRPVSRQPADTAPQSDPSAAIPLSQYPQLRQLAWHLPGVQALPPATALALYERNWRHIDLVHLDPTERALIDSLIATFGKGHLLV